VDLRLVAVVLCICFFAAKPIYGSILEARFKKYAEAGTAALQDGRLPEAEQFLRKSLSYTQVQTIQLRNMMIGCKQNLAQALIRLRRYAEAATQAEDAVRLLTTYAPNRADFVNALQILAETYDQLARYQEAVTVYTWAIDHLSELRSGQSALLPSYMNLSIALLRAGEYGKALAKILTAVELEKLKDPDEAATGARLRLAHVHQERGEFPEAERVYAEVLRIREAKFGRKHEKTALAIANIAWLRCLEGRYEESDTLAREALEGLADAKAGAEVQHTMAVVCTRTGRCGEAEDLFSRVLAIRTESLIPDHPALSALKADIAELRMAQGRFDDAEALLAAAQASIESKLGADHPDVAGVYYKLARLRIRQSRPAEAKPLLEAALKTMTRTAPGHPNTAGCRAAYEALLS
jgi:tetratricopeptide (TPR) repeat protein